MHDNLCVFSRVRLRRFAAILAVLSLAGSAALPAEHVHRARVGHHDDHGAIIHRHYEAHHPDRATRVDHQEDDQDLEWLAGTVAIGRHLQHAPAPAALPAALAVDLSRARLSESAVRHSERSAHDPPWFASYG